ncbi:MAG: hypothetical protein EKK55_01130 [Rhodocyclaceae bacterium]|nr:MAG: hypothetical protein EKK55_01130 [Rhodocyclaceae bacterium]
MKTYRCCSSAHRRELLTEARKRVAPTPSPINVALADATLEAAGKALLRANRVGRLVKAIYQRRWRAFVASDKLDASLLTQGLRAELEAAIRRELIATANATAAVTMRAVADVVPVEALLIVHRREEELRKLSVPGVVKEGPQLDYSGDETSKDATETANAFVSLPTAAATKALVDEPFNGEAWTDRLKNWLPVEADIAREVSNGLSLGKSNREIAQALLPLVNDVAYKAERIARTEVHRVNVTAQMRSVDKALGPAIEGWRYTATLDDRTSQEHAALDGRIYPRGAEKPRLPSRPNCRCTYTPVMKSYADLGVPASMASILDEPFGGRAAQTWNKITKSMEGTALANDSRYPQWFNAQPIAKQREILGQRTFDAAQPKSGGKAVWSKAIAARGIAPPPPQTFDAPPPQPKFLGPIPGSNPDPEIPLIQIPPTPGAPPEKDEPIPAPPAGFKPTPARKRKRRRPTA